MVEFTIFELHLHDGIDFSPMGAIGDASEDVAELFGEETPEETTATEESGSGARVALGIVAGLAALGGVAYALRRVRSEVDVEIEVDDIEEVVD
jgi:hypothetical protein